MPAIAPPGSAPAHEDAHTPSATEAEKEMSATSATRIRERGLMGEW
jgi:hypothetical protein